MPLQSTKSRKHSSRAATRVFAQIPAPQRLYGRESDVEALLAAFDDSCEGQSAMALVAGSSGIGKTALITELKSPIQRQRGNFLSGKFDQVVRGIPYGALFPAFGAFVQQLAAESEELRSRWRAQLLDSLGENTSVLAQVIPQVELLLGPQPPPPALGSAESQNRFQLVFRNLVAALASREHPLVLFLDDLQWADTATLTLLESLLTSREICHFLFIGAYRANEVGTGHVLTRTISALEAARAKIHRIGLGPLRLSDVIDLLRDTLQSDRAKVTPLAHFLVERTDGNPFFMLQFMQTLHTEGLLCFDPARRQWSFDIDAIQAVAPSGGVVELMKHRLRGFKAETQKMLTLAACIGNRFEEEMLAVISRCPAERVGSVLTPPVREGLVVRRERNAAEASYSFLHDRVQQAAYALIPENRKRQLHLTIGRLLLERWGEDCGEKCFDLVHHLNAGGGLIVDPKERLTTARLNLAAGRKAKEATAYQAALGYFNEGIALLPEDAWTEVYAIAFALHLEAAECNFLCGAFEQAEREFDLLLIHAKSRLDKAKVYSLQILQSESLARYDDAIRSGQEGLTLFDLSFPDTVEEREAALEAELGQIDSLLGGREIASLFDLPPMRDPEMCAVMKLLTALHTPCYLSADKVLTLLNTSKMVRLSLEHGNADESCYAYVLHAMHVGAIRGDHTAGSEFGRLALRLSERLNNPALRARVCMNVGWNIAIWREPFAAGLAPTREAFRLAHQSGLFAEAAYALFNEGYLEFFSAADLTAVRKIYASNLEYIRGVKMHRFANAPQIILQWTRALQGLTKSGTSFTDGSFDEETFLQAYQGDGFFDMFYFVAKLAVLYTFGEYRSAQLAARQAEQVVREYAGTIWDQLTVFYGALTRAALFPELAPDQKGVVENKLARSNERMEHWAKNSPANFLPQHLLVSAEVARVREEKEEAGRLYDQALEAASKQGCPRDRALILEARGRFLIQQSKKTEGVQSLGQALHEYRTWGAAAKVAQLEQAHAELLKLRTSPKPEVAALPGTHEARYRTLLELHSALAGNLTREELLPAVCEVLQRVMSCDRGGLALYQTETDRFRILTTVGFSETGRLAIGKEIDRKFVFTDEQFVMPRAVVRHLSPSKSNNPYEAMLVAEGIRSNCNAPLIFQGRPVGVVGVASLKENDYSDEEAQLMQLVANQVALAVTNMQAFDEITALKSRVQAENVYLREEIRSEHNFAEIVGESPLLLQSLRKIEQVAGTDSTVLLLGETGTGKELFARAIHERSRRKTRPLVKVNCGAISAGLVESELFGHVKGAFTGALANRDGRFKVADGGTLFLDEVSELPAETQVKLLRVLQEQEFEPIGSSRTVKVDVRIIAATNRDLEASVGSGKFRADLFYRLNVFPIEVPPLRKRTGDIPLLATFFLQKSARRLGKQITQIPSETMQRLTSYQWPGNIRELQNVIERAVILSPGPLLVVEREGLLASSPTNQNEAQGTKRPEASVHLTDVQRRHIESVLEQTAWVIEGDRGAARLLDMHPNTLRFRMRKLGIVRPQRQL